MWWRALVAFVFLLVMARAETEAAEHPTIHHAGILVAVDSGSSALVLDERERLGPPVITRIGVGADTVLVRVIRTGGEFHGQEIRLGQLRPGEYLVVRGRDLGDRHLADMVWSLGPAR